MLIGIGRVAAVVAGLIALAAFWPRAFKVTDLMVLRNKYLGAEPHFTKLRILDSQIQMVQLQGAVLGDKAKRLKAAMAALGFAVVLVAIGISVH